MARIETYNFDYNISVNDYVIGTDGDNLNATKNYKILTFLDYLGTQYNLNSTDLLFNYNNVDSGSVGNGEISTNNYSDDTIFMSDVTNIYVSKVTVFGQLIDDIINTIGNEGLTIMFTDMSNRNNLGIFKVDATSDVDGNTINMSVTSSTSVGNISAGKVMGIRIGIGGGGGSVVDDNEYDISWDGDTNAVSKNALYDKIEGLVTLDTYQVITETKVFSGGTGVNAKSINCQHGLSIGNYVDLTGFLEFLPKVSSNYTSVNINAYQGDGHQYRFGVFQGDWVFQGTSETYTSTVVPYTRLKQPYTEPRTQTFQDKDGTIAHLEDIPNSSWFEAVTTSVTTSGTTTTSLPNINVPENTLIDNGDMFEFEFFFTSTGSTNSSTIRVTVGMTGATGTMSSLSGLTGSVYYVVKGWIQKMSSTTFNMTCSLSNGFSTRRIGLSGASLSSGTWESSQTFVWSIQDTAGNDTFTLESGWIRSAS